jgi:hypothetical protein
MTIKYCKFSLQKLINFSSNKREIIYNFSTSAEIMLEHNKLWSICSIKLPTKDQFWKIYFVWNDYWLWVGGDLLEWLIGFFREKSWKIWKTHWKILINFSNKNWSHFPPPHPTKQSSKCVNIWPRHKISFKLILLLINNGFLLFN